MRASPLTSLLVAISIVLWFAALPRASAQPAAPSSIARLDLPDAPAVESFPDGYQSAPHPATASISGTVLDIGGAIVPSAQVTLIGPEGAIERTTFSDSGGEFTFADLPPGKFKVKVSSKNMESFVSSEISLRTGEKHQLPEIFLPIAVMNADVLVTVTQEQLATEQVHAAEQQRALGIFPNFYTSYIWDAAPLNTRQKFDLAVHAITDPVAFVGAGALAGIQQANNTFRGYGQGAQGYGKRVGAAYADDAIARIIGSAILPSILRQDPRYFYRGTGSTLARAIYAVGSTVICKGDNGRRQPNYSHIGGAFAGGAIANLYHPAKDRGISLTITNALIDTAGNAGNNLIREFLLKKLTPKLPDYANGKPMSEASPVSKTP